MSQKQACAIFATSFLAGLLVTAVVFQPFSIAPTTTPYFGFPGESEALNAPEQFGSFGPHYSFPTSATGGY